MRCSAMLAVGALALTPLRSEAQVSGAIIIGGGSVGGILTIGERRPVVREVVVVERLVPRVIVVQRLHPRRHQQHPVWGHRGRHDRVVVYYDCRDGVYYDWPYRRGLVAREVVRYGSRYYRLEDHDCDRDAIWSDDRYEGRAWLRW